MIFSTAQRICVSLERVERRHHLFDLRHQDCVVCLGAGVLSTQVLDHVMVDSRQGESFVVDKAAVEPDTDCF